MWTANVLFSFQFGSWSALIFAIVNDRSSFTLMNGIELWSTALFPFCVFPLFCLSHSIFSTTTMPSMARPCLRTHLYAHITDRIAWHIMKYTVGIFSKYELQQQQQRRFVILLTAWHISRIPIFSSFVVILFTSHNTFYVRNVQMAKHIMASLRKLPTYVIPLLFMFMYTFWCFPTIS